MLVRSFRLPGADTDAPTRGLIERATAILNEGAAGHEAQLTPDHVKQLHQPINQLHKSLQQVERKIDWIGHNESDKPDHVLLGYAAAENAARTSETGHDRLDEFSLARHHNSTVRDDTEALKFLETTAISASALRCSAYVLKVLDRLSDKLAPMPSSQLETQVIEAKARLDLAHEAAQKARAIYTTTRRSKSATREQLDTALTNREEADYEHDKAEDAFERLVSLPEIGESRAVEILAQHPIVKTREQLTKIIGKRADVLSRRSLPFFFDGIHVQQIRKQHRALRERETVLREQLKALNLSDSEIKREVKEWRAHFIHKTHGEVVLSHVSDSASKVTQDINTNMDLQAHEINANIDLQTHRISDLSEAQTQQIKDFARKGFFALEQLQTHLLGDLRSTLIEQANRIMDSHRAGFSEIKQLTRENREIVVQALHAEVDRAIIAGEHGLENFRQLSLQDQQACFREIHNHIDQHLADTQALHKKLSPMSVNDDPNESFGNRATRFIGDVLQNGIFSTIGNRLKKGVQQTAAPTKAGPSREPLALPAPQTSHRTIEQRVMQRIAVDEVARVVERGGRELLDGGNADNILELL